MSKWLTSDYYFVLVATVYPMALALYVIVIRQCLPCNQNLIIIIIIILICIVLVCAVLFCYS